MPRPSSASTAHLEQKNGKWRVSIAVPRDLHDKLGTRLKRSLHTDSLATANRVKPQVIADLRAIIDHARSTMAIGGAEGDRTPDLRIANAALSQLSYGPDLMGLPLWAKRGHLGFAVRGCQERSGGAHAPGVAGAEGAA